ncbi:MAG TPA: tRNA pseudouridine(55) synthase TruB [Nocardioidaceae bacterium]|nr:tRNA pseudouridine(55) synthase TruB [Nocardioidaceae bacterium]
MTASTSGASGLVVVDKPAGMTSHDVVARVRRIAGTRKVGHAGTLDPMATGVLVLGINKATRLLGHLMLTEKQYDGTVRLGASTTTDDAEGESLGQSATGSLTEQDVRATAERFVGDIDQVPSAVSAIKVDGERAYKRVRAGESVDLPARPVTVHALEVTALRRTGDFLDVDISVRCSSGTYIRALARDLGFLLGVGGHLVSLRRTAVGPFRLDEARTLDQLGDAFQMVPVDDVAARCFATYTVDDQGARDVSFGRKLPLELGATGPVAMLDAQGGFLALYEQRGAVAAPVAVFTG